jgi:uracil phosphoribosyltransferase
MGEIEGFVAEGHCAAVGGFQKVDAAQQCGLARTAGAEDGDDVALVDLDIDALENFNRAEGFLNILDKADNAFVSAYRFYKDKECHEVGIHIDYLATPDLTNKTLIIADPMLATGGSMELGLKAFETKGIPAKVHLCCVIASQQGVDYIQKVFGDTNYTLWCGAIDPDLNDHLYIVPGLGDAGDLAYGGKL